MLSLEDKIFIVQQWASSHSLTTIRRSFRQRDARYHGKTYPLKSERVIRYVINNFKQYGTVGDRRKRYNMDRTRIMSPRKVEAVIKGIRRVYRNKQKVSIHSTARRLRVSRYFVGRILRKVLRKKPYTENVQFSCNNAGWCHTTHSFNDEGVPETNVWQ